MQKTQDTSNTRIQQKPVYRTQEQTAARTEDTWKRGKLTGTKLKFETYMGLHKPASFTSVYGCKQTIDRTS